MKDSTVRLVWALLVAAAKLGAQGNLAACQVPGLTGDVRCGSVEVWENRTAATGRRLQLSVIVARATGPDRAPDPLFLFAGGPGQPASGMVDFANAAFSATRVTRDIVFADARGTGRSAALQCRLYRTPAQLFGDFYPASSVRFCHDSLAQGADLAQFTTANIADDIDDVRRALGYGPINIYGTSYGSRLALTFVRRHPESVRSMALKAVAPPDMRAPSSYAKDGERAIQLLARDCAADSACVRAYPAFLDEFRAVIERAKSGGLVAAVKQRDGTTDTVALSRDVVSSTIMGVLQSVSSRASIPMAIHRAFTGDPAPLAQLVQQYRAALDGGAISMGMHLSVVCSEDSPGLNLTAAARDNADTFLGDARVRAQVNACRDWPLGPSAILADARPVTSRVPVLLFSGELDPNTPAHWAEQAARILPNSRHVILPHVAHNFSSVVECGAALMSEFFATARVPDLDVSCTAQIKLPPFVVPRP